MKETVIYLKDDEARIFLIMRKYQNVFEKVFSIKSGSAEFHFDDKGELQTVEYYTKEKVT